MTDTLELLESQKEAMETERARMDADISDLEAAIKAIKSRRGASSPKSNAAPKKAATAKTRTKTVRKRTVAKKAAPAKAESTKPAPAKAAPAAESKPGAKRARKSTGKVSLDDGIIKAVKAGQSTPVMILDYVTGKLSIETTINSVRTRVSRLKRDGKLLRGKDGWTLPTA